MARDILIIAIVMFCTALFHTNYTYAMDTRASGQQSFDPELEEEFKWLRAEAEAMTSIATGSSQPLYRAPAVATVIAAEDIEAMGATTLHEVLETVPGLHIYPMLGVGNSILRTGEKW